jgi:TRAP-type C4-dicarboxylate transport system permease small subunit
VADKVIQGNIARVIHGASVAAAVLAGLCLVLMMAQMTLDVVLKFAFNAPIQGTLEIVSIYYMVAVVFLPLAIVELRHEHICVDLLVQFLPRRARNFSYVMTALVSAAFFTILGYQTLLDAIAATQRGDILMGGALILTWPSRWALPVGFFLITFAVLFNAWRALSDPDQFDPTPVSPDAEGA